MSTQIEFARKGIITKEMIAVAHEEGIADEYVRDMIAAGKIVIPNNTNRKSKIVGIGKGLRTKVNASIGTSSDIVDIDAECRKAKIAEDEGADKLMEEMLFDVIERQCEDGIAFMAIHCGINLYTIERLRKQGYRYGGLVSKGGASMVGWMLANNKENPLYEKFDRVVKILKKYDVVLSLGNGLRAGAIHDSSDRAQIQELVINCELSDIGQQMGCQMMVEGPGHIPLDEIEANIILQKR